MAKDTLLYRGHRFKSARIDVDQTLMTEAKPQVWEARRPQGFWRTFAEADLSKAEIIKAFLAKYGDPNGMLPKRSKLEGWQEVQGHLKAAATAYEAPDANGISRVTDNAERVEHGRSLGIPGEGKLHFPAVFEPVKGGGLVPRVEALGTFMEMSAVMMIVNRMPTRRCDECGHWFALETTRAIYCSAACKSAAHRRMKGAA